MMVSFLVQVKQIAVGTFLGVYLESNSNTACFITTLLFLTTLYSDVGVVFFLRLWTSIALDYTIWQEGVEIEVNDFILLARGNIHINKEQGPSTP